MQQNEQYFLSLNTFTRNLISVWTNPGAVRKLSSKDIETINHAIVNAPRLSEKITVYKTIRDKYDDRDYKFPYSTSLDLNETLVFLYTNTETGEIFDSSQNMEKYGYDGSLLKIEIEPNTPLLYVEEYSGVKEVLLQSIRRGELIEIDSELKTYIDENTPNYPILVNEITLRYRPYPRTYRDFSISNEEIIRRLTTFSTLSLEKLEVNFESSIGCIFNISLCIYSGRKVFICKDEKDNVRLYGTKYGTHGVENTKSIIYFLPADDIENLEVPPYVIPDELDYDKIKPSAPKLYEISEDDIEFVSGWKERIEDVFRIPHHIDGSYINHDLFLFLKKYFYNPNYFTEMHTYRFSYRDYKFEIECTTPFLKGFYYASLVFEDLKIENLPYFTPQMRNYDGFLLTIKNKDFEAFSKGTVVGARFIQLIINKIKAGHLELGFGFLEKNRDKYEEYFTRLELV